MRFIVVGLVVGPLLVSCTHPSSAAGGAEGPAAPTGKVLAPVALRWEEVARSPTAATLVAHVVRRAPLPLPLLVRVEVPDGATLSKGRQSFTLEASATTGDVTETYELAFAATPAADLVFRADAESTSMGLHLAATYRFGRAEPKPEAPAATGPGTSIGGRSTGPSIPLDGK